MINEPIFNKHNLLITNDFALFVDKAIKRKQGGDRYDSLTSSKRLKLSTERTDAPTLHQNFSLHDTGMYSVYAVVNSCHDFFKF